MAGYEFTVNRRYGHHDGPTEWEFSTRIKEVAARMLAMKGHRWVCAVRVSEDGWNGTFCIRRGSPPEVAPSIMVYLGSFPGPEEEAAARVVQCLNRE